MHSETELKIKIKMGKMIIEMKNTIEIHNKMDYIGARLDMFQCTNNFWKFQIMFKLPE